MIVTLVTAGAEAGNDGIGVGIKARPYSKQPLRKVERTRKMEAYGSSGRWVVDHGKCVCAGRNNQMVIGGAA